MKEYKATPNYYKFCINGNLIDVNDILKSLSYKLDGKCTHIQFNYLSNSIEYLLRSFEKGQLLSDLKKANSEINFLIKDLEENDNK